MGEVIALGFSREVFSTDAEHRRELRIDRVVQVGEPGGAFGERAAVLAAKLRGDGGFLGEFVLRPEIQYGHILALEAALGVVSNARPEGEVLDGGVLHERFETGVVAELAVALGKTVR